LFSCRKTIYCFDSFLFSGNKNNALSPKPWKIKSLSCNFPSLLPGRRCCVHGQCARCQCLHSLSLESHSAVSESLWPTRGLKALVWEGPSRSPYWFTCSEVLPVQLPPSARGWHPRHSRGGEEGGEEKAGRGNGEEGKRTLISKTLVSSFLVSLGAEPPPPPLYVKCLGFWPPRGQSYKFVK
jgi:hypothetical protein